MRVQVYEDSVPGNEGCRKAAFWEVVTWSEVECGFDYLPGAIFMAPRRNI